MFKKQFSAFFSRGFSLIEMTVVLGLLAGAGVFLGQILFQSQKGQKKVSANFDFTTKMWEVFNVLQNTSYCNPTANLVFKEKTAAGTLTLAKLSSENTPTTNTVNWIGYQLGSGAAAQNIKVLEEGDVIENTLTVSQITFERQKDTAGNIVPAQASTPVGITTHYVNLVITANPTSGSGFPGTKTIKLTLITDTPTTNPTNELVGCASSLIFRSNCPTGYTLIGTPYTAEAYCMSTSKRTKTTYGEAVRICASEGYHLCSTSEWSGACWSGKVPELIPLLISSRSLLPNNDTTNFTYREWAAGFLEGANPPGAPSLTNFGLGTVMGYNFGVGASDANCHYPFQQRLVNEVQYFASYRCCFN